MYFVFPRFSGRVRGKPDPVPPPHTLQFRGRCQIEIGPHTFSETSFYEAQYHPPAPPPTPAFIQSPWQSSQYTGYVPYGHPNPNPNPQAASQTPAVQHTSPLLSSLTSMTAITPSLINQVNAAAASSPTLANLLHLAAAGQGSPEQLKTLGLLIQSLAAPESQQALSSAANLMKSSAPAPAPPYPPVVLAPKEFDLVFQYYETSYERWILPRGPVICEKVADTRTPDLSYDIVLTMALQPPRVPRSSGEVVDLEKPSSQVVTIRLKRPPPAVWETIWRWVGGEEKLKENRIILDDLKKQTERVYLAHRIPQNSLLTQLQNATASSYVMKSIKPGPVVVPKPKRKPAQRKPAQPTPAVQPQTAPQASGSAAAVAVPIPATSSLNPATPSPAPRPSASSQPEPKRRKVSKPSKPITPVAQIRCVSCQQTDVPLILGGRFCRPCVDSGKATTIYVPYRHPQAQYQAQQNPPAYAQPQQNIPVAPVYAPTSSQSGSSLPNPNPAPPAG
ncbi:hypothetical protein B0H19DRAFT_1128177 [Mycena capillaripes]|nr:hypothetical protein B0H19DRAFT_1128177 [Mycena capillaripes]